MQKPYHRFRLSGAALFCLRCPSRGACSAEPAKKAPQVDPAVQGLVQGACKARPPAITPRRTKTLRTP